MKYKYAPLSIQPDDQSGLFAIRLLRLLPDTDRDSSLWCQLIETHIPDYRRRKSTTPQGTRHVQYQALSYTWGEPVFTKTLHVLNGTETAGDIYITKNLHSALQNLREPDKILVLWVDAVCIDQSNIMERNSQVSNIPQTYSEASAVLVWVGTDSLQNDGQLCLDFFSQLARHISSGPGLSERPDRGSWRRRFKINQMVTTFLDSTKPRVIASFLARPWFRRRWIIQEVVLAPDVSIHCGASSIPWTTFELALTELFDNDKGGFSDEHRTTLRTMSRIRRADSGAKSQAPLDTLVEFSSFACSNPRDRLYALYGVIQHWLPGSPDEVQTGSVDYASSVGAIYTNFVRPMMHLNHSRPSDAVYNPHTHVLQLAAALKHGIKHGESQAPGEICEKIPTWVPDWTGTLCYKSLNHSPLDRDASSDVPVRQIEILPFKDGTRILFSTGIVHDIITTSISLDISLMFDSVHQAKNALNDFLCSVDSRCQETGFFRGGDRDSYHPTGEHFVVALATALVANWEHTPENSYFAQNPRFPKDFLEQLGSSQHHLPEILHKWPAYVELITETMRGRCLFFTQLGYIGIGAVNVQADDVVCILSGTRIPFLLRPSNGRVVTFQDGLASIAGCYNVQNDNVFKVHVKNIAEEPSKHCTFELVGDAYVHGLMDGEAAKKLGPRLEDALKILPIV
jgi:hypothetical protein